MESTDQVIHDMIREFHEELKESRIESKPIVDGVESNLGPLHQVGETVFDRWASLL